MSTEIYFFSGTGNSFFVANELQKRIPGSRTIPIIGLLHKDIIPVNAASVGVVFPVHALTIPIAVKRFLGKVDLRPAEYVFAIATRLGTVFRGFEKMDRILSKQNKHLDAHFILNMCNNECRQEGYKVPTEADILSLERVVLSKLDLIQDVIRKKTASHEKDLDFNVEYLDHPIINCILEKLVLLGMATSEYIGGVNYFCTDSSCIGCGICEKVCLSRKIKMMDKRPVWQRKVLCYMCFACLNYCPEKAVQINDIPGVKSYTRVNGRFPHPYATARDISLQKEILPPVEESSLSQQNSCPSSPTAV